MKNRTEKTSEIIGVVQRGVAGHLTYLAAISGWGTNSELALYPVIGNIFSVRGWKVICQWRLPRDTNRRGASKTIDFVAFPPASHENQLAVEVKVVSSRRKVSEIDVSEDVKKLLRFKEISKGALSYLLIVGRKSDLDKRYLFVGDEKIFLKDKKQVVADVGKTKWGSVALRV